jgi:phage-related minor tail protein
MGNLNIAIELAGKDLGAGSLISNITQKIGGLGSAALAGGLTVVGGALAGIGAAAIGVGTAALAAGTSMDEAMDLITVKTGATGAELAGLETAFKQTFTSVPTTSGLAAQAIAELNQRLGITGDVLSTTASKMLELTRLTGGDLSTNTELITRVLGDWGIANDEAGATMDQLFTISQQTGIGIDQLATSVVQFGAPLRLMGFSFQDAISLFGKWNKEGVNAELVMGSLRIAAGKFAREQGNANAIVSGGVENMAEAQTKLLELQVKLEKATAAQEKLNASGSAAEQALNANKIAEYQKQITELQDAMAKGEFVYKATEASQSGLRDQLMETFDAIKNETDASKALAMGMDVFGARAGPDMVAAIREGRFSIEDLQKALEASDGAIANASASTADWGERVQVMQNKITTALAPLGGAFLDTASLVLDEFMPAFDEAVPVVTNLFTLAAPVVKDFFGLFKGNQGALDTLAADLGTLGTALGLDGAQISTFVTWVGTQIPIAIQNATNYWNTVLMPAFQTAWGWIQANLIPLFNQVWAILAQGYQDALPQLTTFVQGVLLPGLQNLWTWIQANLLPLLGQLWTWFAANLPGAIQVLVDFYTNVWLPAQIAVWTFIVDNVIPLLGQLWEWLATNVPAAIQTLSDFWTGTLLPAIQTVWGWLNGTLFPLIRSIANFLDAVFSLAVRALAGVWQNVLQPALQNVYSWLDKNVFPIMRAFGSYLSDQLSPAVRIAGAVVQGLVDGALGALSRIWGGINDGIRGAVGGLNDLADRLRNINLPSWLTPGSPTPLEYGLIGIARAMNDVSRVALPTFNQAMPATAGASISAGGSGALGSSGGGQSVVINIDARGASNASAVEDAGYRGARRALAEAGYKADVQRRIGG